jgi:type II restriction enzyme
MGAGNWTGWTDDVLNILRLMRLNEEEFFQLDSVYHAETLLAKAHPRNTHIRAKIRQQLQVLRDYGYIEFTDKKGVYQLSISIGTEENLEKLVK